MDVLESMVANFFSLSLLFCYNRMSSEVQKSHKKMEKLRDELGSDIFNSWREEHANEVLTVQEKAAVERAHQSVPSN